MEILLGIPLTFRRKCLSPLIPRFLRFLTCWCLMNVFFIYVSCFVSLIFILDFICLTFKAIFFSFSFINLRFLFKDFSSMFMFVSFIYPVLVSMFFLIFLFGTMISLFFYFLMLIVFFITIHRNLGHIILFLFFFILDDRIFLSYLEFKLK